MAKIHKDSKFEQNFWKWPKMAKLLVGLVREEAHAEALFSAVLKTLPQETFNSRIKQKILSKSLSWTPHPCPIRQAEYLAHTSMPFSERKRTSSISPNKQKQRLLPVGQTWRVGTSISCNFSGSSAPPFPSIQNSARCKIRLFIRNRKLQCIVLTSLLL